MTRPIVCKPYVFWGIQADNRVRPEGWPTEPLRPSRHWASVAVAAADDWRGQPPVVRQRTSAQIVPSQSVVTLRHPDGTPRWWLVEFVAEPQMGYQIDSPANDTPVDSRPHQTRIGSGADGNLVLHFAEPSRSATLSMQVVIAEQSHRFTFRSVSERNRHGALSSTMQWIGKIESTDNPQLTRSQPTRSQPTRSQLDKLRVKLTAESIEPLNQFRFEASLTNHASAQHPGGTWDLGDPATVMIDRWSMQIESPYGSSDLSSDQTTAALMLVDDLGQTLARGSFVSVRQDGSGGAHHDSVNHQLPGGKMASDAVACRVEISKDNQRVVDNHASGRPHPVILLGDDKQTMAIGVQNFWQTFPRSLSACGEGATVSLLDGSIVGPIHLQPGERSMGRMAVQMGATAANDIAGFITPALYGLQSPTRDDAAWTIETSQLTSSAVEVKSDRLDKQYQTLAHQCINGDDSFWQKSETIDEFGWRNFGDIYGDHEAVYATDRTLISHYNNQYDCTLGLATHYFLTGDRRFYDWCVWSADHSACIDTYHTTDDKLVYNGGLFWHTYHYADAGLATHRSYPGGLSADEVFASGKTLSDLGETGDRLTQNYAVGGGPAASHNYNTGWMWAYALTGRAMYRDAAIDAAEYVMRLECGDKTPFRFLSRSDTGYSTNSGAGYHGPGRASANSTMALLTGHELSFDDRYLDRAAMLMRRTVHPADDLPALDLLNAELRWFYTMYLQSLCRFSDYKVRLGQRDDDFLYGVAVLRHYSRWMLENERPTLDDADRLQYPTETWAAQDLRKWQVLEHAARYQDDPQIRDRMRRRADEFYEYVVQYLTDSETRSLCRPVVLLLNFGWQRTWYHYRRSDPTFVQTIDHDFGKPMRFRPQRGIAVKRAKTIVLAVTAMAGLVVSASIAWVVNTGTIGR